MIALSQFPRRGTELTLRFFGAQGTAPVASFRVPNPARRDYPTWTPQTLPTAANSGDLTATLFPCAPPVRAMNNAMYTAEYARLMAETITLPVSLSSHGQPTTDWQMSEAELSDATGNRCPTNGRGQAQSLFLADFPRQFCSGEAAFRFTATFERTPFADFASDEIWRLPNTLRPAKGKFLRSGAKTTVDGATVELVGISGGGAVTWGQAAEERLTSSLPAVRVRITPAHSGLRLLLRGTDERGRPLVGVTQNGFDHRRYRWIYSTEGLDDNTAVCDSFDAHDKGFSQSFSGHQHSLGQPDYAAETFFFQPPSGAKRLTLEFALNRNRVFTFTTALPRP